MVVIIHRNYIPIPTTYQVPKWEITCMHREEGKVKEELTHYGEICFSENGVTMRYVYTFDFSYGCAPSWAPLANSQHEWMQPP